MGRAALLSVGLVALLVVACAAHSRHQPPGMARDEGESSGTESGVASIAEQDGFELSAAKTRSPRITGKAAYEIQTAGYGADEKPAPEPAKGRAPILIYKASLTMAVFDVQPGLKAVEAAARELGGFLAKQNNFTIIVRVPAARFQEALARLEKLGDVTSKDVEARDVTEEYLDLELRIKSARAVRERLEQLLAKAAKVEDSIAIEKELQRVMGELESMEGKLKYLRDQAQYSTISVTFSSRAKELVAKDTFKLPFPWLEQLGLGRLLELR